MKNNNKSSKGNKEVQAYRIIKSKSKNESTAWKYSKFNYTQIQSSD